MFEEYEVGYLFGFCFMFGGQLVQEIDYVVSVCGVCLVLVDDDGVCVNMSVFWLVQMGWQVVVLDGFFDVDFSERGVWSVLLLR